MRKSNITNIGIDHLLERRVGFIIMIRPTFDDSSCHSLIMTLLVSQFHK